MDDPGGPYRLALIAVFLMFSAFFSGSETALFATPKRLLRLLRSGQSERMVAELTGRPAVTLSTILIGNTLVNVVFTGSVTALVLAGSLQREVAEMYATVLSFLLLLTFGEVVPKVVAANRPLAFLGVALAPLYYWSKLLIPVSYVLEGMCNLVERLFPVPAESLRVASEDVIGVALMEGKSSGQITDTAEETILNIFDTDTTPVRRVMTRRKDIRAISIESSASQAAELMLETGYSRLPVYQGTLDNLVGLIYMKDLLRDDADAVRLSHLLRPLLSIMPGESVEQVLKVLGKNRTHMAAVRSPNGELLGIITLEDLVEEIVGEITDEHDVPPVRGDN